MIALSPAPRRSVGPDLSALFVGARGRYGRIDRAWIRVHRSGCERPSAPAFVQERDPPLNDGVARALRRGFPPLFDAHSARASVLSASAERCQSATPMSG